MNTISNPGFSPKDPSETIVVAFDFSSLADTVSAPVVTATRHGGTADVNPSAIKSGSPSVAGAKVLQKITAGVLGTNYLLRCEVDGPNGTHYALAGVLQVRSA